MLVVNRFAVPSGDGSAEGERSFLGAAEAALGALAARPGFRRGQLGRAADDPQHWVMVSEWENVGSYRRALSDLQVRLAAVPVLALAVDGPSAFEVLVDVRPGEPHRVHLADRAVEHGAAGQRGEMGRHGASPGPRDG
ncbi:MAG: antibiotic biosynthesis monooxygenase [Actinobacteria bacterium]|nr:antibiotic biosynthesis monooxygenase [Actinomycetota bacterium]MBI3687776.1 antibiotic biosynthesis monooxygenase [Actinomycetota bacterium]